MERASVSALQEETKMLQILWWIIVGLIVGALARFLVPGRDPMGWLSTQVAFFSLWSARFYWF
jgi:Na+/H+-dicarboxylate symporter